MQNQQRLENLCQWIATILDREPPQLETVSGDASFRRYFRFVHQQQSIIAVDAPPQQENNLAFWQIGSLLASQKIRVPEFFHVNLDDGFMLISDLGNQLLLPELNQSNVSIYYPKAIDIIVQLQKIPVEKIADLKPYDEQKLAFELSLFETWFVNKHLGLQLSSEQQVIVDQVFKQLIDSALKQNQRLTHRDFHSRNIMLVENKDLAVIDFQDAVLGPVSYDLVSLLKDCYIQWSEEHLQEWLNYYYNLATQDIPNQTPLVKASKAEFIRAFDWMGLQRHLKVLGIFCRLNYRDNKLAYLKDLPLTFQYVKQVTTKYPEFKDFNQLLENLIEPAFEAKQ